MAVLFKTNKKFFFNCKLISITLTLNVTLNFLNLPSLGARQARDASGRLVLGRTLKLDTLNEGESYKYKC